MLENPMVREERTPREPHHAPSYSGIELTTQAQRDTVNAAMLEQFKKDMEEKERGKVQHIQQIKPVA